MTETERDKLLLVLTEMNRSVILLPTDLTPEIWENLDRKWKALQVLMDKLLGEIIVDPQEKEVEGEETRGTEAQGGVMEHPGKECPQVHKGMSHKEWSKLAKSMRTGFDEGREHKSE